MKIDKDNIEEKMFDYYEGNLSMKEKEQLLNFIHLHEEYVADFAYWAQSYAIANEVVSNYGLRSTLLKNPEVRPFYKRTWFYVGNVLVVAFLMSYFLQLKTYNSVHVQYKLADTHMVSVNDSSKVKGKTPKVVSQIEEVQRAPEFIGIPLCGIKELPRESVENIEIKQESSDMLTKHGNNQTMDTLFYVPRLDTNNSTLPDSGVKKTYEPKKKKRMPVKFATDDEFIEQNLDF